MNIVGAGFAGLIAAHILPNARIFEASPQPTRSHRAVLRFRSEVVAQATGVEFQRVLVRKGIQSNNVQHSVCTIRQANDYSTKVTGSIAGDRSIWNLEPVVRYVAPETFYEQLIEAVSGRVMWNAPYDYLNTPKPPVLSTAPLPIVLRALSIETPLQFQRAPITVVRARVRNCAGVNQTIYFPDPHLHVYRATITGSLLTVEAVSSIGEGEMGIVLGAFGIGQVEELDRGEQRYGKIVPLEASERKALLHRLTVEHNVFSVGRFATWRNILLDDVVQDIAVVRRLLRAGQYDKALFASTNP